MNSNDPMEVALWGMSAHVAAALKISDESTADESMFDPKVFYWQHLNIAVDFAVKIMSYFRVKAEGSTIDDPTAELEELTRLFFAFSNQDQQAILSYLRTTLKGTKA